MSPMSTIALIDTHAHVLPFWDDGADSWKTSLAMLRHAEEDGITKVVCTPHILSKQDFQEENILIERFEELKSRANAENINLAIYMGSEIFIHPDLELHQCIATPAENGRYYLVEFPMSLTPETVVKSFLNLIFKDKIPIIAHPERYLRIMNNVNEVYHYVERGALIQLNAGSIIGTFGQMIKELAAQLLDANLVHVVASDAHDLKSRPLRLKAAFHYVSSKWGSEKAIRLFHENPQKILNGEKLLTEEHRPMQTKPKSKWSQYIRVFIKKSGNK